MRSAHAWIVFVKPLARGRLGAAPLGELAGMTSGERADDMALGVAFAMACALVTSIEFCVVPTIVRAAGVQAHVTVGMWILLIYACVILPALLAGRKLMAWFPSTIARDGVDGLLPLGWRSPAERRWLITRGVVGPSTHIMLCLALCNMPLADGMTLAFTYVLFAAFFGWALLGEPLRLEHLTVSVLCAAGTILVIQPDAIFGGEEMRAAAREPHYWLGACMATGSAIANGLTTVVMRKLRCDHGTHLFTITFAYAAGLFGLAGTFCALDHSLTGFVLRLSSWQQWALTATGVVVALLGTVLLALAVRVTQASVIATVRLLGIVFAAVWQWLVFGHAWGLLEALGAGLVALGVVLSTASEAVRKSRAKEGDRSSLLPLSATASSSEASSWSGLQHRQSPSARLVGRGGGGTAVVAHGVRPRSVAPRTMRALVAHEVGGALVIDADFPKPVIKSPADVLVRIESSALNPVDWKMLDTGFLVPSWPHVFGCGLAGTVEAVGDEAAQDFKPGDKVWTFSFGAFKELCVVPCQVLGKVAPGMSMDEACSLGAGALTAQLMLKHHLEGTNMCSPTLIYGASTSVGMYAVQLAKAQGRRVVAVASSHNEELLTGIGADGFVDYKISGWEARAVELIGGKASQPIALDCIAYPQTVSACARIIVACGGHGPSEARIVTTGGTTMDEQVPGVEVQEAMLGETYQNLATFQMVAGYVKEISELLAALALKPNPIEVLGGLEKVSGGFDLMRANKVSGKKLVVRVQESRHQ